jgi:Protein of unknown function (DUF3618)
VTHTTERAQVSMEQAADRAGVELRAPAEIEAEIERTRARLAGTIDEITDRVHPRRLAQRGAERLKGTVVDEQGRPRPRPLIVAAAGAAVLIAFTVWRKRR